MRVPRVYTDQLLGAGDTVTLESNPSAHLSRVLRMGTGDAVTLFNGDGGEYPARIISADKRRVVVETGERVEPCNESPLQVELAIAVSRGDRMDWIIQKSTELGVNKITPLITARVEVKLNSERMAKRLAHWQHIAISACEQCGRNRVPEIAPVVTLQTWLPSPDADLRLVLHHRADAGPQAEQSPPGSVALLIGPEGGLDEGEIEAAEAANFEALRLGPRVLRTETAPLAALAIVQSRWGDMS